MYALDSFDILFGNMYPLVGVDFIEITQKMNSRKFYLTDFSVCIFLHKDYFIAGKYYNGK